MYESDDPYSIWKRPDVAAVMFRNLKRFIQESDWEFFVLCVLSPDDPDLKELETLCKEYGHRAVYYKNDPLGEKINAGLNYAYEHYEFDYLMNFGSDDLIHPQILELYRMPAEEKVPVFGINSLYFYCNYTRKTYYFRCYTDGIAVGAGRMIHRSILDRMKKKGIEVYDNTLNRSLDTNSSDRIYRWTGTANKVIPSGEFPYVVDVKTHTNINHITQIEIHKTQIEQVPPDFLKQFYEI